MQLSASQNTISVQNEERAVFEASLNAVRVRQPDIVDRLLKCNPDGTSLVSFPGAAGVKILVEGSQDSGKTIESGDSSTAPSNKLLISAFQSYRRLSGVLSASSKPHVSSASAGGEGLELDPVTLLTGYKSRYFKLAFFSKAQICRALRTFADSRQLVTCYLRETDSRQGQAAFYSFVDFTASGPSQGLITLRNSVDGSNSSISLTDFISLFSHVCLWI